MCVLPWINTSSDGREKRDVVDQCWHYTRKMVFYMIGLGLGDPQDITVRGLEVVKKCARVFLEGYTSILAGGKEALEEFYGRKIILADREQVEQGSDDLLANSGQQDVALLVVGDPFGATTHTDLKLRAHELDIAVEVINNASIMNAVSCCGLQLYHYGETVSIPFWLDGWEPESFIDKINKNLKKGLHTLCLLDIKVKEQSLENMLRGRKIYEPPRFMRVNQAAQQLLAIIERRKSRSSETDEGCLSPSSKCVGVVRVGTETQNIVSGTLKELSTMDLGDPLHSLIVCGDCHTMEEKAVAKLSSYYNGRDTKEGKKGQLDIIGLGLGQPKDITIKGLEMVKGADRVFLEAYTSVMTGGKEALEKFFGREIIEADREMVEQKPEKILEGAKEGGKVVVLVVGDPLSATTHSDLVTCAIDEGIGVSLVHNASIFNAVGCCGLQLYTFGETVSIPLWQDSWKPQCFYDKICQNLESGWHTLCLLDIKVKEKSDENLVKGRNVLELPRFMTAAQAAAQLLAIIKSTEEAGKESVLQSDQQVIGLARVGTKTEKMRTATLEEMAHTDLGDPLHSLVIVGETHPMEQEFVNMYLNK
ncbi:diphthine methyl ester synthase isoform X2 [Oratosquilla oratoria]|uniref:diphthine methyl ester synthase isoform X2 n=1 Tax=Oratosquilla oratoria TaxID=337810 RepID=UPI003F75E20C